MKILVTGGTGYLGSYVADYLRVCGYNIRLSARHIPSYMKEWAGDFEIFLGDVLDNEFCNRVTKGVDYICHFAALNEVECEIYPEHAIRVNGIGTYNLLNGALQNNVSRFYYISTFHIYGTIQTNVITEDTPPSPVSHYAISHYVAERFCEQFWLRKGLYYNILRISNGYGAPLFKEIDRWSLVLNDFCKSALTRKEIVLKTKGTQKRDFISLEDISRAIQILINGQKQEYRIFNVGGENSISIYKLAEIVARVYKNDFSEKIDIRILNDSVDASKDAPFIFDITRIKGIGFLPQADMEKEISKLLGMCCEFQHNERT